MKLKKILAGALAAVMTLSLAVLPTAAVSFPDIQKHWAKPYIDDVVEAGLFIGFDANTFGPDELMTAGMALATCARIAVPKEMRAKIGADRLKEVEGLLQGKQTWFYNEFAVCLELGILTHTELANIVKLEALGEPLGKAEFARYLVRAMGLDSVAQGLGVYELNFNDQASISQSLRPYVYLLNVNGVVDGTPENNFLPNTHVTRAVTATMFSRALLRMSEKKVAIELPRYTTYRWSAGIISDVSAGEDGAVLLSLKNDLSGAKSIIVPATATIYQDNCVVQRTALKATAHARVCYDGAGAVQSIRVVAADRMKEASGAIAALAEDEIVLGGVSYQINRFTEVEAGGKTGDRAIIDYDAGYESATVTTDILGNVLVLRLQGGTRELGGILTAVDVNALGVTTITLSGYDGSVQRLVIPADAAVTATGGVSVVLSSGHVGRHLTLRVENNNVTAISAVLVDTAGKYVQGVLRGVTAKALPPTVTIGDVSTNRQTTYPLADGAAVTYSGKPVALDSLSNGSYITARLEGAMIEVLSVWPGAAYTEGTLRITYGSPTILEVTRADGVVVPFEIKTATLEDVDILRSGVGASITQLRTGDTVIVTVQYNVVSRIEAKPQSANVSGTVESTTSNATGTTMEIRLADNTLKQYLASEGTTVTQNGTVIPVSNVKYGAKVAMVTSGEQILSMEVTQAVTSSTKLTGTVYIAGSRLNVTLLVSDGVAETRAVKVNIPSGLKIMDGTTGAEISATKLVDGDILEVWGSYSKDEFNATVIVKVG